MSQADEPDLWRQDLTGAVKQWIETGLPDERRILKACGRADEVAVYAYGRNADVWWAGVKGKLARTRNLAVYVLPADATQALAGLAERGMAMHFNVQDAAVWVSAARGDAAVAERGRASRRERVYQYVDISGVAV